MSQSPGGNKLTPELCGRLPGVASPVDSPSVSLMDVTCHLQEAIRHDEMEKVTKQTSVGPHQVFPGLH